jgi:hypothetical protein
LGLLGWLGALKQELKVLTIRSLIILSLMKWLKALFVIAK